MKNVDTLAEAFLASWNQFLNDLVKAAKLRAAPGRTRRAYEERLVPLVEKIVTDLRDDQPSLLKAIHAELMEKGAPWPELSYLRREFEFFTQLVAEIAHDRSDRENVGDGGINNAIEAGVAINGSLENLVGNLPEKWRITLRILNEVLDLLKKAA